MYDKIMVPVDLAHADKLEKALETAAELAKQHRSTVCYVGVTTGVPGSVAHDPEAFAGKLDEFARKSGMAHGIDVTSKAVASHDPATDLPDTLIEMAETLGADVIVMASHVPGLPEHIFASNAGYVAQHAPISVFVVR